jgi:hypothetical protein
LAVVAAPAFADSTATPPPGGVAQAPDGGLVMSSQICATLAGNAAGVPSADYQPGVDANGNAVAPADLPPADLSASSAAPSPAIDNFPIEIDQHLAGKFNIPNTGGIGGKAILGYVTLRGNQAYFNGQPLSADQSAALAEACRNAKH